MGGLGQAVGAFAGRRTLVVGDAMLDSYVRGRSERLSREAPVPIVELERQDDAPGGAANAAANLAALGAEVRLLAVVGDDDEARRLERSLTALGVACDALLRDPARVTLAKRRIMAAGQMLVRLDQGRRTELTDSVRSSVEERLSTSYAWAEAVLVSDYGYGVVDDAVIAMLGELRARAPRLLVVDAKEPERFAPLAPDAAKPNYSEAVRLLGERAAEPSRRAAQIVAGAPRLLDRCGSRMVAVTVDADGAVLLERDREPYRTYARPAANANAAGAGDTFVAALTLALAGGASPTEATEIAQAAASVAVTQDGTSTCTREQLAHTIDAGADALVAEEELVSRLEAQRRLGQRIVFTNGCFDILHRGHVTYLNRAKALGDVLVVALNSDGGVRRLKGMGRPINSLRDRASVLAALSCVDLLVAFDEPTPVRLIERARPDLYVKGGDYLAADLPERHAVEAAGGSVHILPFVEDRSTSSIIARIREPRPEASPDTGAVRSPTGVSLAGR